MNGGGADIPVCPGMAAPIGTLGTPGSEPEDSNDLRRFGKY